MRRTSAGLGVAVVAVLGVAAFGASPALANDAPVCQDIEVTTGSGQPVSVVADCTDPDLGPSALSYQIVDFPGSGSLSFSSSGGGVIDTATYRSFVGFTDDDDTYTYRASDGADNSTTATVTVHVGGTPPGNQAPACPESTVFAPSDGHVDVSGNCTDAEDNPISYGISAFPTGGSLGFLGPSSVRYTPNSGTTSDSFGYTATDGFHPQVGVTVHITVTDPGEDTFETAPDATDTEPYVAKVTTTQPGGVSIDAREVTATPPTGYFLLNQEFDINAPDALSTTDPLRLEFTIDSSQVPVDPVIVFRNGDPVDECVGDPGEADPDPCVEEPTFEGGDLHIVVLTTEASVWNLGVADGGDDSPQVSELGPAHSWLGLKNSDDQGTRFDLRAELLNNGTPIASGLERCINGVTRNPAQAIEAAVPWDEFDPVSISSGDTLSLRLSTRIGTNPNDTKCAGHANAVGLRLYYDSAARASAFDATITPDPSQTLYLRSNGNACANKESTGVTTRSLDSTAPGGANAKCKDSAAIKFTGGNAWKEIGTWSLAPLP